ncbi:MAG: CRISPR-associated helicase Cas3' [Planctomycetota bacterium]
MSWEPLAVHLRWVAQGEAGVCPGAALLARSFASCDWAELAGWWHDLGKYTDEFQERLRLANGLPAEDPSIEQSSKVDHSTFGAKLAVEHGSLGWLLAYAIAGHHGGMPDSECLRHRLLKPIPRAHPPDELTARTLPHHLPIRTSSNRAWNGLSFGMFTRFVFSALVDADFLATEAFMNASRHAERISASPPALSELGPHLDRHLDGVTKNATGNSVNAARAAVLADCRAAAGHPPGLFTLTVPTGGGKTLSSLAFALDHARRHGLRRVIYAIPYTSIIEQNAEVFRNALAGAGPNAVLEHHTNFDPTDERENRWSRLASENWDAPLVVTTNVQLLESLHHNKPSRCRKVHNIAKSVIILDEAQQLRVELLEPTLAALDELVRNYGCTVVLCTATQPAIVHRNDFPIGLADPTEIVSNVPRLFASLRRTRVEPVRTIEPEHLASELSAHERMLCIVNTKARARRVYEELDALGAESQHTPSAEPSCVHLSTNMCAAHRTEVLDDVRTRIKEKRPCRLISTSLIEAGVDISFPIVFRELAGLDSIAQAAGRCNREGESREPGRVVVFDTLDTLDKPYPQIHAQVQATRTVVRAHQDDPLAPEAIEAYFRELYWKHTGRWDRGHREQSVMKCYKVNRADASHPFVFKFESAARAYRLIDDDQTPVVVPWKEEGRALVDRLRDPSRPVDRDTRRRAHRFTVGVREIDDLITRLIVAPAGEHAPGMFVLIEPQAYDDRLGLMIEAEYDPGHYIA